MIYMKGVPDLPQCGFSSLAVRVLKLYGKYNIACYSIFFFMCTACLSPVPSLSMIVVAFLSPVLSLSMIMTNRNELTIQWDNF